MAPMEVAGKPGVGGSMTAQGGADDKVGGREGGRGAGWGWVHRRHAVTLRQAAAAVGGSLKHEHNLIHERGLGTVERHVKTWREVAELLLQPVLRHVRGWVCRLGIDLQHQHDGYRHLVARKRSLLHALLLIGMASNHDGEQCVVSLARRSGIEIGRPAYLLHVVLESWQCREARAAAAQLASDIKLFLEVVAGGALEQLHAAARARTEHLACVR
eukprot:scaffold1143_cov107-Isochrysis_galbana.AAC.3